MAIKVLESLHNKSEDLCVDLFVRDDTTFGYEEYRRDYEDGGGWFSLQRYGAQIFDSTEQAKADALLRVEWLKELNSL